MTYADGIMLEEVNNNRSDHGKLIWPDGKVGELNDRQWQWQANMA